MNLELLSRHDHQLTIFFVFLWLIAALCLVGFQAIDGHWWSALAVASAFAILIAGQLLKKRWAYQASAILLMIANVFAVIGFFPVYGDEFSAGAWLRLFVLLIISIICIGCCLILYLLQQKEKKAIP
jgi:hypothetical protein